MAISVKLQNFEGPLDLLLHLIDKNKVNIYDIPIVEITNQYLEYIRQMQEQDLNVVSEFLVMAAMLLDIKSKMLLPKEINEEGEEQDPRDELVHQLLEYKLYKYMAEELKERQVHAQLSFYKDATLPQEVLKYEAPVELDELLADVTLAKLYQVFRSVIRRRIDKVDPIRSKFGQIEKEEVSLSDKMDFVEQYARTQQKFSFCHLLEKGKSKIQIIVTFLAILELMKTGMIQISQEQIFDDIQIYSLIYQPT